MKFVAIFACAAFALWLLAGFIEWWFEE